MSQRSIPSKCREVIAFALLIGALFAEVLDAQALWPPVKYWLIVAVQDRESSGPVVTASIRASGSPRVFTTDTSGRLAIHLESGTIRVHVRALGYSPGDTTIDIVSDTLISILLAKTTQLDTVRVTSAATPNHLREFESRRQLGTGRFLVEADLVVEGNRPFASVAATRFPGLKQVWDANGQVHIASTRSSCGYQEPGLKRGGLSSCASSKPCLVQMYMDGLRLSEEDFDVIRTEHLTAVEYYTGARVPAQYRIGGSACGVMLLWTKR